MSNHDDQVDSLILAFNNLFNELPGDLSAQILSTIKTHIGVACAEALAISLLAAAEAQPTAVESLIISVTRALLSTEGLLVTDEDAGYSDTAFNSVFIIQLSDYLSNTIHENQLHVPKKTTVSPQNTVLIAALFSGSAVQNDLANSNFIYAFTRQGLQLPDAQFEDERKEIVAIGACLQLLVAGKKMLEKWLAASDGLETVIAALESLKEKKTVTYPKGVELLESTITAAKTGFVASLTPSDAWKSLFP